MKKFIEYLKIQKEWSSIVFGKGRRTKGILEHIEKEMVEVEENPTDVFEWVDIAILALDGAWRAGFTPEEVAQAMADKQVKNIGRKWHPIVSEDKAIVHVKEDKVDEVAAATGGSGLEIKKFCRDCGIFGLSSCTSSSPTADACDRAVFPVAAPTHDKPSPVEEKKTCNNCAENYTIGGCRIKQAGIPGDCCGGHESSAPSSKSLVSKEPPCLGCENINTKLCDDSCKESMKPSGL